MGSLLSEKIVQQIPAIAGYNRGMWKSLYGFDTTTSAKYLDKQELLYADPYCPNADTYYRASNDLMFFTKCMKSGLPVVKEQVMAYSPTRDELFPATALVKQDSIPTTSVLDPYDNKIYIASPLIIGRTDFNPIMLKALNPGNAIAKPPHTLDIPIVCEIRESYTKIFDQEIFHALLATVSRYIGQNEVPLTVLWNQNRNGCNS